MHDDPYETPRTPPATPPVIDPDVKASTAADHAGDSDARGEVAGNRSNPGKIDKKRSEELVERQNLDGAGEIALDQTKPY